MEDANSTFRLRDPPLKSPRRKFSREKWTTSRNRIAWKILFNMQTKTRSRLHSIAVILFQIWRQVVLEYAYSMYGQAVKPVGVPCWMTSKAVAVEVWNQSTWMLEMFVNYFLSSYQPRVELIPSKRLYRRLSEVLERCRINAHTRIKTYNTRNK